MQNLFEYGRLHLMDVNLVLCLLTKVTRKHSIEIRAACTQHAAVSSEHFIPNEQFHVTEILALPQFMEFA